MIALHKLVIAHALVVSLPFNALSYDPISNASMGETTINVTPDVDELSALRDLYDSAGGAGWSAPWPSPVSWPSSVAGLDSLVFTGVTVEDGDIVGLTLSSRGLKGRLPVSLGRLTSLRTLHLNGNVRLSFDEFPSWLCSLTSLVSIDFFQVRLNSSIPDCFFERLTSLEWVYFGRSGLRGSIPGNIDRASSLQSIFLQENRLTGPIPPSLGELEELVRFVASSNQLTGSLPGTLLNARRLVIFGVSNNQLTSMADLTGHPNVRNLQLNVSGNRLSFGSLERNYRGVDSHPYRVFTVSGQSDVPVTGNGRVVFDEGGGLEITSQDVGPGGVLRWEYKNASGQWEDISGQDEDPAHDRLLLGNADTSRIGFYRYVSTHPWFPGLTITSAEVEVKMRATAPGVDYAPRPLYNGTITGMAWHTGEVEGAANSSRSGMYLLDYDGKYQLKDAVWAEPGEGGRYTTGDNRYRVHNLSYDLNGNIESLWRSDSSGILRDEFDYEYEAAIDKPQTNQLQKIAGHSTYHYNAMGELYYEDNAVDSLDKYVTYDVSGKVTHVYSDAREEDGELVYDEADLKVSYEYDDRGFRIAKKNHETGWETWYVRDATGRIMSVYEKPGEAGVMTQVEVPVYGAQKLGTRYPQQDGSVAYELTDHLGNVRGLMKRIVHRFTATMEDNGEVSYTNPRVAEGAFFANVSETARADGRAGWNHTPASYAVPSPHQSSYLPGDGIVSAALGPALGLKVQAGDEVSLSVYGKLLAPAGTNPGRLVALDLARALQRVDITVLGEQAVSQATLPLAGLTGFFVGKETTALASLNYIFLDMDYQVVSTGYEYMGEEALTDPVSLAGPWTKLSKTLAIDQPGYLYVFVNNESVGVGAIFDDMEVSMVGDRLVETTDYYPFGSVLASAKMDEGDDYRFGYQGQFAEKDKETGWNHFELRQYDPLVGRFTTVDPARQFHSPYVSNGNNPIIGTDPTGGFSPIFSSINGMFLGLDSKGWNGPILFMSPMDFQAYGGSGMDHSIAVANSIGAEEMSFGPYLEGWSNVGAKFAKVAGIDVSDLHNNKVSVGLGAKIFGTEITVDQFNNGTYGGFASVASGMVLSISLGLDGMLQRDKAGVMLLEQANPMINTLIHEGVHIMQRKKNGGGPQGREEYLKAELEAIEVQKKDDSWGNSNLYFQGKMETAKWRMKEELEKIKLKKMNR